MAHPNVTRKSVCKKEKRSFALISKEELDAGIDFRRSSMPPTWTQTGGQFEAFQWGTPSVQVVLQGSQGTFSKIWVSFLLGSWVGIDVSGKPRSMFSMGITPNWTRYAAFKSIQTPLLWGEKNIYTLHSSSDMMLHRKYIEWPSWKWHLSLATPTKMRETNNQSMSHGKIESAQVFTCEGSQMIAPTNPNRTSNVKTKYTTSCSCNDFSMTS